MEIIKETQYKKPFCDTKTEYIIKGTYEEVYDEYIDGKEKEWFYEPYYKIDEIEKDKMYRVTKIDPFLD